MDDKKLTVLIAEYNQLKDEQISRIGFRDNFIYVMLAIFGAIFSYAFNNQNNKEALLIIPIVCFVIGWVYLNNDAKISQIADYIKNDLSKKISPDESFDAFSWEKYNKRTLKRKYRKIIQFAVDIITFIGTGCLSLVVYLTTDSSIDAVFLCIMLVDVLLLLILLISFMIFSDA